MVGGTNYPRGDSEEKKQRKSCIMMLSECLYAMIQLDGFAPERLKAVRTELSARILYVWSVVTSVHLPH